MVSGKRRGVAMKDDERALLIRLAELQGNKTLRPREFSFATDVAVLMGIHENRANYILEKWDDKGWWNCGVSLRTGWLEPKGIEQAEIEKAKMSIDGEHREESCPTT